jgi:hypothetical protein
MCDLDFNTFFTGQWAPNNLDGKKVYDKEFLLALRNGPASRKKPDNLPDVIIADDRGVRLFFTFVTDRYVIFFYSD